MVDNVVILPVVPYRPTAEDNVPPQACFASAMDAGLQDVVIVGRRRTGEIEAWSSDADADKAIGLMMRGVRWLSECEQAALEQSNDTAE